MAILLDSSGRVVLNNGSARVGSAGGACCCSPRGMLVTVSGVQACCYQTVINNGNTIWRKSIINIDGSYLFTASQLPVAEGYNQSTQVCTCGNSRGFIVQKTGLFKVYQSTQPTGSDFGCSSDMTEFYQSNNFGIDIVYRYHDNYVSVDIAVVDDTLLYRTIGDTQVLIASGAFGTTLSNIRTECTTLPYIGVRGGTVRVDLT